MRAPDYTLTPKNYEIIDPVLILSAVRCWACRKSTRVAALGGRDSDEDTVAITGVQAVAAPVDRLLNETCPYYRLAHSRAADLWAYMNVCEHCASLQGDHFLHSEPDAPFFAIGKQQPVPTIVEIDGSLAILVDQEPYADIGCSLVDDG